MGNPNLAQRLAGLRSCGCTDAELCPQHHQALSPRERPTRRRSTRTADQGRQQPPRDAA